MTPRTKTPVMADVARLARCDVSTVSLALRGDPRITPATRQRVESAAERLGYRVNPLISAWIALRRSRKPGGSAVPLAYLNCHPAGVDWGGNPHFTAIFQGAEERAREFGYSLREFRLADYEGRAAALDRVLCTRGIQGVIVGPTLRQHSLAGLSWPRFSLVTIGYALRAPVLHRVTEDHYVGLKLAFESCLNRGFRRIGMAVTGVHHALRRERWMAAYLVEQRLRVDPEHRLPVLEVTAGAEDERATVAERWCREHRPEVVLADQPAFWEQRRCAAVGFALSDGAPTHGVHENNLGIGRHAADLVIALLQRNERGLPASRQTILVEPEFRE